MIEEAVATEGEVDSFLDIVVKVAASAMRADSCAIFLKDEGGKTLTQRAGIGSHELRRVIRAYPLPEGQQIKECEGEQICNPPKCTNKPPREDLPNMPDPRRVGLTAWIAATGKSFHASNFAELSGHCHHQGGYDKWNFPKEKNTVCGAFLGVPLRVGGTITGVLKVENISNSERVDPRDFSKEAQKQFEILAQDIALAILRLQVHSPARYRVIRDAQKTILEILRGGLGVPELAKKVVTETAKLFNARACALFLKEGNRLIQPPWAAYGWAEKGPKVREYLLVREDAIKEDPSVQADKVGLTVWMAVKQRKFIAKSNRELTQHPHHKGTFDPNNFEVERGEKCESFMGVPLVVEGKLIGVLKVETKKKVADGEEEYTYFNEQDELVFDLIANSAAIAIQNALLLEARRLADRVLASPNNDAVLKVLHEFVRDREEAVDTIHHAANYVAPNDPAKAQTVQSFAGLLDPDFPLAVLGQLAESVRPPLKDLLNALHVAACSSSLEDIRTMFASNTFSFASVVDQSFMLRELGGLLTELFADLNPQLSVYRHHPRRRNALAQTRRVIDRVASRLAGLNVFERRLLERVIKQWSGVVNEALAAFHSIPIPYVAGTPLSAESPLFFGRSEMFDWIHEKLCIPAPSQKNVLVLHGGWHVGKTSILLQLKGGPLGARTREGIDFPIYPVFIDLQGIADPGTGHFLLGMADAIRTVLRSRSIECAAADESTFEKSPYGAFTRFLATVHENLVGERAGLLVLMLDEFELLYQRVQREKIDKDVFPYLRSLMQHQQGVTFILAGRHTLEEIESQFKTPLYSVSLHKEIGFLAHDEATRLIQEPVKESAVTYDDAVVSRILRLTGGHPYLIQQLCYNCIERLNEAAGGYEVTHEHLQPAIETALQPSNSWLFSDMWADIGAPAREALKLLARLLDGESSWIPAATLRTALAHRLPREDEGAAALEKLTKHRLLISKPFPPANELRYRFRVDLLRRYALGQPD
ncbi:MAG: GAF domain-containing protein [Verrucomicrobia bacterium]|nr:GAF domain-containing protein [Verrucomicrobiota bacterium]